MLFNRGMVAQMADRKVLGSDLAGSCEIVILSVTQIDGYVVTINNPSCPFVADINWNIIATRYFYLWTIDSQILHGKIDPIIVCWFAWYTLLWRSFEPTVAEWHVLWRRRSTTKPPRLDEDGRLSVLFRSSLFHPS